MGILYPNENKICRHGPISTKHKTFFTVELSQYRKSGSKFSSSKLVAARSDCRRLGNALCFCLPVRPAPAVPERGPKSLAIDIVVKSLDCLLD